MNPYIVLAASIVMSGCTVQFNLWELALVEHSCKQHVRWSLDPRGMRGDLQFTEKCDDF